MRGLAARRGCSGLRAPWGGVAVFDGRSGRPLADIEPPAGGDPVVGLSWTGPGPAPLRGAPRPVSEVPGAPPGSSAPERGRGRAHTLCACSQAGEVSLSVDGARVAAFQLQGFLPPGAPAVANVPRVELLDEPWRVKAVCALEGGGHCRLEVCSSRLAEFMGADLPYFACLSDAEAAAAGARAVAAGLRASCEGLFASRPEALPKAEKPFRDVLKRVEDLQRAVRGVERLALDLRGASFECRSGGAGGERRGAAAGIITAVSDLCKAAAGVEASAFAIDLRTRQAGAALFPPFRSEYQPLRFESSVGGSRLAAASAASAVTTAPAPAQAGPGSGETCLARVREVDDLLEGVQGACRAERAALTGELSKSFELARSQELPVGSVELRGGGGGASFFFSEGPGGDNAVLAVGVPTADPTHLVVRVHRSGATAAAVEEHHIAFPVGTEVVNYLQYSPELLLVLARSVGSGVQPLRLHLLAVPPPPGEALHAGEGVELEPCAPVASLEASKARGLLSVCSRSGQVAVYDIGGPMEEDGWLEDMRG